MYVEKFLKFCILFESCALHNFDSECIEERLARLCSTISVEPTIQENVVSSVSVEKKVICRSSKQKKLRLRRYYKD